MMQIGASMHRHGLTERRVRHKMKSLTVCGCILFAAEGKKVYFYGQKDRLGAVWR